MGRSPDFRPGSAPFPWAACALFLVFGVGLMCFAAGNAGLMLPAAVFLSGGMLLHQVEESHEFRAFLLLFSLCLLMAGLSENWGLILTGLLENAPDAHTLIKAAAPSRTLTVEQLRFEVDSPFPVVTWRALYRFWEWAGVGHDSGIGVMANAFMVALSASLTVSGARSLFGNDARRLRLVGTLSAACGLYWVFGATHLRDCYALLLNAVVLRMVLAFFKSPGPRRLVATLAVFAVASYVMLDVRSEFSTFFILFLAYLGIGWAAAPQSNVWRGVVMGAVLLVAAGAIVVFRNQIFGLIVDVAFNSGRFMSSYKEMLNDGGQAGGLGYSLIVDQPLLIRIVAGTLYMCLYPIPLWWGFNVEFPADHWLRSYQGIFFAAVLPLALMGMGEAFRKIRRGDADRPAWIYLLLGYLTVHFAVVLTTLEGRHLGAFLPMLFLFAVLPDYRVPEVRGRAAFLMKLWYGTIVLGHLAWAFLKFRGG